MTLVRWGREEVWVQVVQSLPEVSSWLAVRRPSSTIRAGQSGGEGREGGGDEGGRGGERSKRRERG